MKAINKKIINVFFIWIIIWFLGCSFDLIWLYLKDEVHFFNVYFIRKPHYPIISSLVFSILLYLLYFRLKKVLFLPFFMVISLINITGLINAFIYRGVLNSSFINAILNSNKKESLEFIHDHFFIISLFIVIYLIGSFILIKSTKNIKIPLYIDLIFLISLAIILKIDWLNIRNNYFPLSIVESYRDLFRTSQENKNRLKSIEKYTFNIDRQDQSNINILLVLGETARRDYFNSFFHNRYDSSRFILYSNTLSNATNTYRSVPMMLSKNTTTNFKDIYSTPSLISYFKKAGFYTSYFTSAPRETFFRSHSILDSYSVEADSGTYAPYVNHLLSTARDLHLLYPLKDLEKHSHNRSNFTILHTNGSHSAYKQRYTSEFEKYKSNSNNDTINYINQYANTFIYKRAFIDSLITFTDRQTTPTLLIYVSDHGENLYDDKRLLSSHGGFTTSPQVEVPLFFYPNSSFQEKKEFQLNQIKENRERKFQTQDLFHTILDISSIKSSDYDSTLSLSSQYFTSRKEHFIYDISISSNGILVSYDSIIELERSIQKSKYYDYQHQLLKDLFL